MSAVHEHDDDHSVARDPGPAKRADEHEQVDEAGATEDTITEADLTAESAAEYFLRALERRWGEYIGALTAREVALVAVDARRLARRGRVTEPGMLQSHSVELAMLASARLLRVCLSTDEGADIARQILLLDGLPMPPTVAPASTSDSPEPTREVAMSAIDREPEPEPVAEPQLTVYWPGTCIMQPHAGGRLRLGGTGLTVTDEAVKFAPVDQSREHAIVSIEELLCEGRQQQSPCLPTTTYFEVTIVDQGQHFVGIGVIPSDYPRHRQPGWEPRSWGFHGDDGKLYEQQPAEDKANKKGETFGTGDVVGCGWVSGEHTTRLFWTKNGKIMPDLRVILRHPSATTLHPAAGLGVGGAVRFNLGTDPSTFHFDVRTGLPREPTNVGDTCMLAPAAAKFADAAAGPLQKHEQGKVDAIDHAREACLVNGWWYEQRALVCPLDLQTTSNAAHKAKAETECEHTLLRVGVGVNDTRSRLTAPLRGPGVLATSVATIRANEPKQIKWTLRLSEASPNQRFVIGVIDDEPAERSQGEPNLQLFPPGLGVRTEEVAGAPCMCQLKLPTKAEELKETEIHIAAGAGHLTIATQKRRQKDDSTDGMALEITPGSEILTAALACKEDTVLRLALAAYAGCELDLVCPVPQVSDRTEITIVCSPLRTYELLPTLLMMAHVGIHYDLVTRDVRAPCLTDHSQPFALRLHHPQTMAAYIARKHDLYPACPATACYVDEMLATVDRCWEKIRSLVEQRGVTAYIECAMDESREWVQYVEHIIAPSESACSEDFQPRNSTWSLADVALLVQSNSMSSGRTAADFAIAGLTSFHRRLCPAIVAAYTPLVGHFNRFRRDCSAVELDLLKSVQLCATEQWLSETCDTMVEQNFKQIREYSLGHTSPSDVEIIMLSIIDPIELPESHREAYSALLTQAFAKVLQLDQDYQDRVTEHQLVAHRLASLLSIPLMSDKRRYAGSLACWAVKQAKSQDASDVRDAKDWYLEAFDLFRAAASQHAPADVSNGAMQQARQCLLDARVCDLKVASATSASLSQKFSSPSHHAALMYDATFVGVETQAWALAFPEACHAVHTVLTEIVLESANSRHELLEQERERVMKLQAGVSLTKTSSGSLLRFSDRAEGGGEPGTRVSVAVNISASRPHHVLSTSATPLEPVAPQQRLSTVLMGSSCGQVILAINGCKEPGDQPNENKVKHSIQNGGPAYMLLKVVQQTNNDACGYHTFFNVITVCRALSSADLESAQSWMQDLQATRAFEQEMSTLQLALRQEAKRRQTDHATQSWEVASILERSHAMWLLQTDGRIATLGGETVFSVIEFVEQHVKSFDLSETIDFHKYVLQEFAEAPADVAMTKAIMIGTTEGRETGHWVGFVASRLPGVQPEFTLLDSQNKVSNKSVGHAAELLVRCFQGQASLLQSVLVHRLAPLVTAVQDTAGQGDTHLAKLRAIKPPSAWRQDELESLQVLMAAGAAVDATQATKLRDGIHSLMRSLDWTHIEGSAPAERDSIAEMARVLVAVGGEVGCEPDFLQLPDAAKPQADGTLVEQLCQMGFSLHAAHRGALAVANRSAEAALSWLVERAGDPAINDPID